MPEGFYCYDLRGSDYDPGRPVSIENKVTVNHAGAVLTPEPVTISKEGFRRLRDNINFLGESLTLADFCDEHKITLASELSNPDESGVKMGGMTLG